MTSDCFLSIVSKDCARDELLVRARRKGDIEKIFPGAVVRRDVNADYLYRAPVKRALVEQAMAEEVRRINYPNFKNSVHEDDLHRAYLRVWMDMADLQPRKPFMSGATLFDNGLPKPKRGRKRR
jgi:hypothetical protein